MVGNAFWVALGGGLGSVIRWYLNVLLPRSESGFPYATFLVNVVGSLMIGIGMGLVAKNNLSESNRLFLLTGFCGGFTTFSTFSFEFFQLFQNQQYGLCFVYIFASLILGGLAVFIGFNYTH